MRKLILDTETSGLSPEKDRIIELACVEMVNDSPTGENITNITTQEILLFLMKQNRYMA